MYRLRKHTSRIRIRYPRIPPLEAWQVNLLVCWVIQFLCLAGFSAAFPFLPFFIRELGVPEGQIELWTGITVAAGGVSMAVVSPIWGFLADRYGRKLMVIRSTFGGALVLAGIAFSGNVHQLLILRLIQGLLTGTVPAFMTLTANFSPPERVGFSLGIMQMAVYTGASVGPLIGGVVADHLGYRWAFLVTAGLLLLAGILAHFFVRETFVRPKHASRPQSFVGSTHAIIGSMPILAVMLTLGGLHAGNTATMPVLPLFVEGLQSREGLVGTATGLVYGGRAVASALSAVVIGRFADRANRRNVLLLCSLLTAVAFLAQAFSPNLTILLLATLAGGLGIGGILPTANAILAQLTPKERQGATFGLSNSIGSACGALGPILGAATASWWGLRAGFLTTTVIFLIVAFWVLAVIPSAKQQRPLVIYHDTEKSSRDNS